jgi:hypothetical protein
MTIRFSNRFGKTIASRRISWSFSPSSQVLRSRVFSDRLLKFVSRRAAVQFRYFRTLAPDRTTINHAGGPALTRYSDLSGTRVRQLHDYELRNSQKPIKSGRKEIAVTSQYHFCSPTAGLPVCTPTSPRIMPAIPAATSAIPREDARTLSLPRADGTSFRANVAVQQKE